MITLDVKTDIAEALKKFAKLEPRQFPFIVSLAMNRTMRVVKQIERDQMTKQLDRPTPYTLNALQTDIATKQKLEASISLKAFAGKGVAAAKYLAPNIYGGGRSYKGLERALQRAGALPMGMYAVPAKNLALDQNGNIPRGLIVKIISELGGFAEGGYMANRTARSAKRKRGFLINFFVVKPGEPANQRGMPPGVYQRNGNWSKMVIAFVKAPTYSKRYTFYETAESQARTLLPAALKNAAEQALATSRDATFTLADLNRILG